MALVSTSRRQGDDPFGIVGTIIDGRYRIEAVAGAGGFGVVYRAFHLGFDSPIAVKVLRLPEHWSNEKKVRRSRAFHREGRVLFNLCHLHPGFVRAFETGAIPTLDGGLAPYLALEWLNGASLAEESRARRVHNLAPLPLTDVLHLLSFPSAALARAHAKGVVHRDIKPANLFAAFDDGELQVKILDFGIAKVVAEDEDDGADAPALTDCDLTSAGTSAFTPRYAAPEQWQRRIGATGKWTDVHALALVCVELVTGKQPLGGEDATECKNACLDARSRPTPAHLGVSLGTEVEAVFERALAIDPLDRFPDVGTFWSALTSAARWSFDRSRVISLASLDESRCKQEDPRPVAMQSANRASGASNTAARDARRGTTAPTRATARSASSRSLPPRARRRNGKALGALGVAAVGAIALLGPGMHVGGPETRSPAPAMVAVTGPSHPTEAAAGPVALSSASAAEAAAPTGDAREIETRPEGSLLPANAPSRGGPFRSAQVAASAPAAAAQGSANTTVVSGAPALESRQPRARGQRARRPRVREPGAPPAAPFFSNAGGAPIEEPRHPAEPLHGDTVAPSSSEVAAPAARRVQTLDALIRNEQLFYRR